MPESPGNIEEINNSLKASLSRGRPDLDQDVVAASKRVLLENISFQPASAPYSMQRDVLRSKYIPLNPIPQDGAGRAGGEKPQKQWQQPNAMTSPGRNEKNGDCLPSPKVVLYPEERVKMEWTRMTRIGAGLVNMGNTCFFNATLQCLTYTAPLVNYCFTNDHREKCKKKDFCMMCEIQNHIKSSLDCGGRSIKPHTILQKLRCIAKHMKWGRQEDAHEFLRFVVDHLQQSCLNGETKLDRFSKETTVINQIFGGYLRSQVTCQRCQAKSDTFDPFMDLSLDIKGVSTVEDALAKFVKPETLDNENAYKCPKCKNKVRAQKRFSIEKAPNVLTLQLNRFDFHHHHLSGKINRFIKYPEKINLRSYMSQRVGEPILYHLYGVLVHSGHTSEQGHYYSFVKSPSKTWYCMNDSNVHQAGSNSVFSADAYVLFYARIKSNISSGPSTPSTTLNHVKNPASPVKTPFIGPTLPSHLKQESLHVNGVHGKPTSEIGTPIKHSTANPVSHAGVTLPKVVSTATPLPGTHSKISFPILTPLQKKQHMLQQQQLQKDDGKRIVLQIKHGNSTTMEKSPDGQSKVVNGDISKQKSVGLVPYNDDSDSEQENIGSGGALSSVNIKTNQQKAATASLGLPQAAGDYSRGLACVQKQSFPSKGDGDSGNLPNTKTLVGQHVSSSFQQTHGDNPSSSASNQSQLPTSHLNYQPTDSNAKHYSTQLPLNTSSKALTHKDLTPSASKLVDAHQEVPLSTTASTTLAAGKSGVMELPVVNMSSYADSGSTKVKAAGGNWLVQAQECAPSPRSSCSSSNSVNSTTEWTVESKDSSNAGKSSHTKVQIPDKVYINKTPSAPVVGYDKPSASNKTPNAAVPDTVKLKDSLIPLPSSAPPEMPHAHVEMKCSRHPHPPERPVTPVGISDKVPLLRSPPSSGMSDGGLRKDKKHKKKHKKNSDCCGFDRLRDDSSSRSDSSSKRKKKHKKEKKYKKKDFTSSDSDSYDDRKEPKKSSVRKHGRTYSDSSSSSDEGRHKQSNRTSDSEDGYEWVEKTVETTNLKDSSSKNSSRASVQSWNHHIKDDVAPRKDTSEKIKTTWDGSRSSACSVGLDGASYKFGNSVLSWDGSKSHNDREVDQEERAKRKRHWSDDYNEEIDAGKTKKVKKHTQETFTNDNPFQKFHSMKHPNLSKDNGPSWSQDHSYHQHHDHHSHKNSSSHHPWVKANSSYHPLNNHSDSRFKAYKPHSSTYA